LSGYIFGSTDADRSNTVADATVLRCCRTGLVIIVDNVHVHSFPTVTSGSRPVIKHIVAHIHIFPFLRRNMRSKTRHTTFVMRHQIMMKGRPVSAYNGSITMFPLRMSGCTKAFRNQTPLYRYVFAAIECTGFINRPTDATMVDDDIPVF